LEPPLGSGPYRISAVEPNRSVELERVKDYWGRDLGLNKGRYNYDRIRYEYFADQTAVLEAFKARVFDFRSENSSKAWATAYDFPAQRKGAVILQMVPHKRPTGMQGFIYNLRRPVFASPRLREALAHAFDVRASGISAGEALEHWPLMNADDVIGAVWSPDDGRVSPSDL
ncbi:MAG: ABC transporter substrate-binding protein, partial [Candidatus Latescibacterota bacterium]|nr:ABC transporter substrate-binding protein [Candidatus Latescibacterota bacterium]